MTRLPLVSLFLLPCLLSACGGKAEKEPATAAPDGPASSALERAAIDAGVVADASAIPPTGLYRQRHESGRDTLCMVPGDDGEMRFGLEAMYGRDIHCQGKGTARISGDKLIMNFARSACIIVARYDGDRVALPGAVDRECERLCNDPASLEGVSFPRVSRSASVAKDARASDKAALCE